MQGALRAVLIVAAATAALAASQPSGATTVLPLTFDELAATAELVLAGRVTSLRTEKDERGRLWTHVDIAVREVLAGEHQRARYKLKLAGGTLDGRRVRVAGMPEMSPGESVLLFIAGNSRLGCPVVGWNQGNLRTMPEPGTGREIVTDARGNPLVEAEPGRHPRYRDREPHVPPGFTIHHGASLAARETRPGLSLETFRERLSRARGQHERGPPRGTTP